MAASTTKVKFNKTSCYFCNEWFENGDIESHLVVCGQILEKCSNRCGAYLARKDMDRHLNRCPEGFGEGEVKQTINGVGTSSSSPTASSSSEQQEKLRELEGEVIALRGTLNEEIRQRLTLITDIGQMKKRSVLADGWTAKVGDVLNALKKCINEETESRCVDIERCKMDINKLLKQHQQIESWRLELTTRFNKLEGEMQKVPTAEQQQQQLSAESNRKPGDAKLVMIESRLNYMQSELENLRLRQQQQLTNEQDQKQPQQERQNGEGRGELAVAGTLAAIEEIESKLHTVDIVLEDHHNSIRHFQEQTQKQLRDLHSDMDPMRLVLQEQLDKQAKLDYELKGVVNTVNETEDTAEKYQKTLEKYRRETYYTKQRLDDLQVHLEHQDKLVVIQNTQGHLIWRIDQFDKRFRESQENELMLKSPLFCNRMYGYTLRLEASLNGIGTWRGRNLIVGLVVVNGYYDNLLEWPCVLVGTVTLRDQPEDRTMAVDFTKTVLARRKHQHFEKNQYIHIPHQVLRSEHYVRDDAIFLEVRIDQQ